MNGVLKKFFVLVMICCVFSTVFAQEETKGEFVFSGSIKTGLRVIGTNMKGEVTEPKWEGGDPYDTYVLVYSDDVGGLSFDYTNLEGGRDGYALRIDLAALYTNGPFGFKVNVRKQMKTEYYGSTVDQEPPARITNGYAWFEFLKLGKFSAGIIDDSVWGTDTLGGTGTDTNYSTGTGLRLEIMPLPGLSFGGLLLYPGYNYGWEPGGGDADPNEPSLAHLLGEAALGASYTSDIISATLAVNLSHKKDGAAAGTDILAGIKYRPIAPLTFLLDGKFTRLGGADETAGNTEGYFTAEYQVLNPLTLGLRVHVNQVAENLYKSQGADAWKVDSDYRLYGSWQFTDKLSAGLESQLNLHGISAAEEKATADLPDGLKSSVYESVYVKPFLKFTFGSLALVVYDQVTFQGGAVRGGTGGYYNTAKDKYIGYLDNAFQLDMVWTF